LKKTKLIIFIRIFKTVLRIVFNNYPYKKIILQYITVSSTYVMFSKTYHCLFSRRKKQNIYFWF